MPLLIEKIENANPKLIKFTFWSVFFFDEGKKFVEEVEDELDDVDGALLVF